MIGVMAAAASAKRAVMASGFIFRWRWQCLFMAKCAGRRVGAVKIVTGAQKLRGVLFVTVVMLVGGRWQAARGRLSRCVEEHHGGGINHLLKL